MLFSIDVIPSSGGLLASDVILTRGAMAVVYVPFGFGDLYGFLQACGVNVPFRSGFFG
jgi:hypothetical protein